MPIKRRCVRPWWHRMDRVYTEGNEEPYYLKGISDGCANGSVGNSRSLTVLNTTLVVMNARETPDPMNPYIAGGTALSAEIRCNERVLAALLRWGAPRTMFMHPFNEVKDEYSDVSRCLVARLFNLICRKRNGTPNVPEALDLDEWSTHEPVTDEREAPIDTAGLKEAGWTVVS